MNKFYATVEQMLNPELRNKAIAVCGSTEEHHGIVLTASAEAKKMGVKTGMANWEARQACPGLIMVPPQYDQYVKYSRLARAIYHRYSDEIEPFGMDECWVDISPLCKTFDTAEEIANEIRETIKSELFKRRDGVFSCFLYQGTAFFKILSVSHRISSECECESVDIVWVCGKFDFFHIFYYILMCNGKTESCTCKGS